MRSSALALDAVVPAAMQHLARIPLTELPTPVRRLERLSHARGLADVWVKRDDLSGPLYGGNKPRKLEFLLGEARRRGRRSVLTVGGIGTHHGLATTICAGQAGMRTLLVLLPQPVTDHVRRALLLDHAYGAELHYAPSVMGVATTAVWLCARGVLRRDYPAIVPVGGTSARGVIGYVNAACELAEQVRRGELPEPRYAFVALGSGGTAAGLMLGFKLAGLRTHVVAVLVTDILPPSAARVIRLARGALRLLRRAQPSLRPPRLGPDDLTIVSDFLGSAYGAPTADGEHARRLALELEGMQLEGTYTAKCFAALLRLAEMSPYRGQPLIFWNTYSSIDPAARVPSLPDFRELPREFHQFFLSDRCFTEPG